MLISVLFNTLKLLALHLVLACAAGLLALAAFCFLKPPTKGPEL